MATASGIRMGKVFVEIGADPKQLFAAIKTVERQLGKLGQFSDKVANSMRSVGTRIAGIGIAAAAPLAIAARQSAAFDDALRNVTASTGATAAQIDQVRAAAMAMSKDMGMGPTAITQAFLELLKAGMPLEQVLGGAGKAATQFARVGEMAVGEAAVVMADAMKVFGVEAEVAANTISAAADASSTDINNLSIAFSQVSAVAGLANQSIQDTATALAIMANAGVKGSDAGTSLKTMLMRLMAPSEEAGKALAAIGLSTESFRGADGQILPLVKVIGVLQRALAGVDQMAQDNIFRDVFGQDAIRAAAILTQTGTDGFAKMRASMSESLTVWQKYNTLMGGLTGATVAASAGFERLAIAVGDHLSGAFASFLQFAGRAAGLLGEFVAVNGETAATYAKVAAAIGIAGTAIVGLGTALGVVNFAMGGIVAAFSLFLVPLGTMVVALGGAAISLAVATVKAVAFGVASAAAALSGAAAFGLLNIAIGGAALFIAAAVTGLVLSLGQAVGQMGLVESAVGSMKATARDAMGVLAELGQIGKDTFGGIYAAINANDLNSAMAIAMNGLKAAFTTGSNAFMNAVDEWGVNLVNAFDFYISQIPFLRFLGPDKFTFSIFGDSTQETNPNMRADQRFADLGARQADRRGRALDAQSRLRDTLRESRDTNIFRAQADEVIAQAGMAPTMDAMRALSEEFHALAATGKLSTDQLKKYADAVDVSTDRLSENTSVANAGPGVNVLRPRREEDAMNWQAGDLLGNIRKAKTSEDLLGLMDEFDALKQFGRLTGDQESDIGNAISQASAMILGQERQSPAEVAGTFSSMALGGLGFGGSLAVQQLAEQKETNKILRERLAVGEVAA
jgi:TP901 family phage tail tape measure protein